MAQTRNDMSRTLTIELPSEVYDYFRQMAAKAGQTPEEWARDRLEAIVPGTVFMTPEERARAVAQLMKHAGAVSVPEAADAHNEQIDRDLAEEYASTHEDSR
jgi:hypothetical protein